MAVLLLMSAGWPRHAPKASQVTTHHPFSIKQPSQASAPPSQGKSHTRRLSTVVLLNRIFLCCLAMQHACPLFVSAHEALAWHALPDAMRIVTNKGFR